MSDNRLPDDLVVVAEDGHGAEASMIEGGLRDAGIEVAVLEFRGAPGAWLTGAQPYWAPKSIAVAAADEQRALEVLASITDVEPGPDEAEEPELEEPDDTVPAYDPDGPAVMSSLRAIAWVVAALLVAGILWSQCSGSV